jgi:urea transport system substrate-binding protein
MKIGILVARSGPAGLWAPSCDAGAMLAAAELNRDGGVLGRPVELALADPGFTETEAVCAAALLAEIDQVDAIVGMHPSDLRDPVRQQIAGRVPYVYTPQYEGGACGRNVLAIGRTDADMLRPAIPWLAEHRHATRFFLVGNDYVWPQKGSLTAARVVAAAGGKIVGRDTIPFGTTDYAPVLERIRRARPDVVITFLVGLEAATFNRAFAAAGLARRMLRFCVAVDETVLYATGADEAENLYSASTYIGSAPSPRTDRYRESHHDSFGSTAPATNVFGRSCYEGVHLVARLAQRSGTGAPAVLARSLSPLAESGAFRQLLPGRAESEPAPVHLVAADGLDFRVLATR